MRILALALVLGMLSGCAAAPLVLSAVGGGLTVAKDVFDLDVSLRNLIKVKEGKNGPVCIPPDQSALQARN